MTPARCLSSIAALMFGLCSTALASPAAGPAPAGTPAEPGAPPPADADPGHEEGFLDALQHRAGAGMGALLYVPPLGIPISGWALEASYGVRHDGHALEADVGVRGIFGGTAPGPVALDFFGAVALAPALSRVWAPRIGVELGVSTTTRSTIDRDDAAPGGFVRAFSATEPAYVGTALSPARFRWGQWHIDAMALFIGSALPEFGRTVRLQVSFLRLGAAF